MARPYEAGFAFAANLLGRVGRTPVSSGFKMFARRRSRPCRKPERIPGAPKKDPAEAGLALIASLVTSCVDAMLRVRRVRCREARCWPVQAPSV